MSDYYIYRRKITGEKRRRQAFLALMLVLALLCAAAGWLWFARDKSAAAIASEPAAELAATIETATATAVPADIATPATAATATSAPTGTAMVPQRILAEVDTALWDSAAAEVPQTIDAEYRNTDARMVALPQLGEVARSRFDTATFLGDSITQGMELYETGFLNAQVRAYRGAGPNSVVNNASCKDEIRGVTEVPLDAVAESAPDYLYLLFGTNSLVAQGNEESFIAYYERMIDMLRERLPGVAFYVQAVPGVQEWVKDKTPGLDNDRIRIVNNLLANMALRKGCYFVNIQEALCYPDGSQLDEFGVKDGIHLQPSGYAAWTAYLTTHTAWDRRNLYVSGNPYYILGT